MTALYQDNKSWLIHNCPKLFQIHAQSVDLNVQFIGRAKKKKHKIDKIDERIEFYTSQKLVESMPTWLAIIFDVVINLFSNARKEVHIFENYKGKCE